MKSYSSYEFQFPRKSHNLFLGFDAGSSDVKVIHSVVNDRSALTLQSVIAEIMECRDDDSGRASVVIKTVCERYLTATAVSYLTLMFALRVVTNFLPLHSKNADEKRHRSIE